MLSVALPPVTKVRDAGRCLAGHDYFGRHQLSAQTSYIVDACQPTSHATEAHD
jgi:hypothetical protein